MAQITMNVPDAPKGMPHNAESTNEHGDSYATLMNSINSNFTDLYATVAGTGGAIVAASITAGDSSLDIVGLASGAGGTVAIAGGAASVTSGGPVTMTGGAGATGTSTTAGGTGANVTITGGAGGLKSGTGTAAGGPGGAALMVGGAGGNTLSTGTDAGGVGGAVTITGGAGGSATSGAGAGGAGGTIRLNPGAGGTGGGASAGLQGVAGQVILGLSSGSSAWGFGAVRSTINSGSTLTAAHHRGQVIFVDTSAGAAGITTLTAGLLSTAFPAMNQGDALPLFVAANHTSNALTITAGSGVTFVGSNTSLNTGATYLQIKGASGTSWDMVRVG